MSINQAEQKCLLHVCCAPCASASLERLLQRGDQVTLFFSNSNIHPAEEYKKRVDEVYKLAETFGVPVAEDVYDHESWLRWVSGYEAEPEKGSRCTRCFRYNLLRTSQAAAEKGYDRFSTTLTISPHKNSRQIFSAGDDLEGFVMDDFKKKNGFARSLELSRELNLYRQRYCGCEFSRQQSNDKL